MAFDHREGCFYDFAIRHRYICCDVVEWSVAERFPTRNAVAFLYRHRLVLDCGMKVIRLSYRPEPPPFILCCGGPSRIDESE